MSAADDRYVAPPPDAPIAWLKQQLENLHESNSIQFSDVQALFAETMFAVIVQNAASVGVRIRRLRHPIQVGINQLSGVVEIEVDPAARPNLYDNPYDYMIVFLNNLFTTVTALHYLPESPDWKTIFQIANALLTEADHQFLDNASREGGDVSASWKQLNQFASKQIERIFVGKLGWSQKKFRKRLISLAAHIDPYTLVMPDFYLGPVSVLTVMRGNDRFYLNIPTAVDHPVSVDEVDFDPDFPFCQYSEDAARVLNGLSRDVFPYWRLPVHNQAGNIHQSPLPRNTQLQLEGSLVLDDVDQVVGFVVDMQQLRVAAPKQPANMKYELINLVTGKMPENNLTKSVPFCESYIELAMGMGSSAVQLFLGHPVGHHAFNNIVSYLLPPEPEIIHGMRRVRILGADGKPLFFYMNFPLKDYGAPRVNPDFFLSGRWQYQDFVDCNAFMGVLTFVAQSQGIDELYARSFYELVDLIEHYEQLPDNSDPSVIREYHERMKERIRFLMQKAIAIAGARLDTMDVSAKIKAMLPWFYLLLLNYRYSPEKRDQEAEIWLAFFREVLSEFSGNAAEDFAWKWNVFIRMPMQPGVYSALLNLMLMQQTGILGWEGCKSAKDRGTEIKIFECFIWYMLFTCSRHANNDHLWRALYQSSVHFTVCLQFFSHATGTMPCASYSKIDPDAPAGEQKVLEFLDNALKMLRKVSRTGQPAKNNLATRRNKIFDNEKTPYELALVRTKNNLVITGILGSIALLLGLIDVGEALTVQGNATTAAVIAGSGVTALTVVAVVFGALTALFALLALCGYRQSRQSKPDTPKVRTPQLRRVVVESIYDDSRRTTPLVKQGRRKPSPSASVGLTALRTPGSLGGGTGYVSLAPGGGGDQTPM